MCNHTCDGQSINIAITSGVLAHERLVEAVLAKIPSLRLLDGRNSQLPRGYELCSASDYPSLPAARERIV